MDVNLGCSVCPVYVAGGVIREALEISCILLRVRGFLSQPFCVDMSPKGSGLDSVA